MLSFPLRQHNYTNRALQSSRKRKAWHDGGGLFDPLEDVRELGGTDEVVVVGYEDGDRSKSSKSCMVYTKFAATRLLVGSGSRPRLLAASGSHRVRNSPPRASWPTVNLARTPSWQRSSRAPPGRQRCLSRSSPAHLVRGRLWRRTGWHKEAARLIAEGGGELEGRPMEEDGGEVDVGS
jgi:hypothetical protein